MMSTPNRTAYVFIFDGFADWEPASAMAELRRTFGFSVKTFALATNPIVSMGGLKVTPDLHLREIRRDSPDVLILPGGDAWMRGEIQEITHLITAVHGRHPVAAICAATLSLAHAGLLNHHRHTSNGDGFIAKYVSAYTGRDLYVKSPAIRDRNVITANGLAPFAFAAEIFRAVAPDRANDIATYEALYSRGLLDD
jgi:putative intracellular protease/amidase